MKNTNFKKLAKAIFTAAVLSSVMIACGKKEDNNVPLNAFTQSCANCEGAGINDYPFFTAQTQAYNQYGGYSSSMRINWSFSGQNIIGGQTQQNYNQYVSPAMSYVGKVSAAGQVTVNSALNLTSCPQIPAGTYNLTTQQIGQWQNGQISGIRVLINGPVSIVANLQAQAYENYYGYGYSSNKGINGYLTVESVNQRGCWGAQFYLY